MLTSRPNQDALIDTSSSANGFLLLVINDPALSKIGILQVQTALVKASRMLGSSIDMAQAMRASTDFAGSMREDAASAPSFLGDRHHMLEPAGLHHSRQHLENGEAHADVKRFAIEGLCLMWTSILRFLST